MFAPSSCPKYCYQATVRPVPLQSGVVYTPSGSVSQQHCISLAGFPHRTERNLICLFSPANQNVSYSHTIVFSQPLNSFLRSLSAVFTLFSLFSLRATKLKPRLRLFMKCLTWLSGRPLAKNPWSFLLHDLSGGGFSLPPQLFNNYSRLNPVILSWQSRRPSCTPM